MSSSSTTSTREALDEAVTRHYFLTDRWKTFFGAVQTVPLICEMRDDKLYPVYRLETSAAPALSERSASTDTSIGPAKAADAAQSLFSARWLHLPGLTTPVRSLVDEDGDLHGLELGTELVYMFPRVDEEHSDADAERRFTRVEQLQIEKMTVRHLPGSVLLEYELFGADNSLIADFANQLAHGYCAIDTSRDQVVGHTTYELEPADTIMYTSFANTRFWRGQGVAKAMVSALMKDVFSRDTVHNGSMFVRGGHQEVRARQVAHHRTKRAPQVVGLYRHYGFDVLPQDDIEYYDDNEPMIRMGGPLKFEVFAKRLGWTYASREELQQDETSKQQQEQQQQEQQQQRHESELT